jgi:hypothetical protein
LLSKTLSGKRKPKVSDKRSSRIVDLTIWMDNIIIERGKKIIAIACSVLPSTGFNLAFK